MSPLTTLPVEVVSQVFLELTSLADVYALARASSAFNGIFQAEKSRILVNIVRQSIHPTVLPLAIVACTVTRNPDYNTLLSTVPYVENETWANSKYRETALYQSCESLMHLLNAIKPFIEDFSVQALGFLEHQINGFEQLPEKKKEMENLSESELGRLQRGFIWFEIYRRIFGGFDNRPKDDESLSNLLSFHIPMTGAEISELYTVQEYLERLMEEAFFKIERFADARAKEDELAATIVALLEAATSSEEPREDDLTQIEKGFCARFLQHLDLSVGDIFHNKSRISQAYKGIAAFLVELGLPFCRKFLFEMSLQQQMTAVRLALSHHRILNLRSITLYNVFSLVLALGMNGEESRKTDSNCHTECLYRDRAYLTSEPWAMFRLVQAYETRQGGCCFWGENRLKAKGFDPESRPDIGLLPLAFAAKLAHFKTVPIAIDGSTLCSSQPALFEDEAGFRKFVIDCDYASDEVVYRFENVIERADSIGQAAR